jgi:hypothetical protein
MMAERRESPGDWFANFIFNLFPSEVKDLATRKAGARIRQPGLRLCHFPVGRVFKQDFLKVRPGIPPSRQRQGAFDEPG